MAESFLNNPTGSVSTSDPLGEILHLLQLEGTFYCVPELSAPWGIEVPDLDGQMVLVAVTEGACVLELQTDDNIELRPGQLLLLPHGRPVILRSSADAASTPLFEIPATRHNPVYETMVFGGGGSITRMTCGVLKVDDMTSSRLTDLLPAYIFLDSFDPDAGTWLHASLKFLAEEARNPKPGGEIVLTRLTDILVVQTIRSWLESAPQEKTGWLAALRDSRVGRALQEFHRAPHQAWSVQGLAAAAGMSRSAFASRFKELVGEGAMQYATRWRMQLARRELLHGECQTAEIASRLGYDSEAAFARAFKRVTGQTPGSVRRGAA